MINDPRASCLGLTHLFYGDHVDLREEPEEERKVREERCRAICATCEIVWPCLHWSLSEEEPWGVWGGMPYQQRRHFRKFLKRKGGIPNNEEELRRLHHLFLVEEEKKRKARTKAKAITKGKSRNGARPVASRNGTGSSSRNGSSPKSKTGNRGNPGRSSGSVSYLRAAGATKRSQGLQGKRRGVH